MMLAGFFKDQKGAIAPMFGLALIPILGFVGIAVDYSRAASARAALQGAIDGATLMLSKDAATLTQAELNQRANDYVNALLNRPEIQSASYQATYTLNPRTLTISGAASLATDFMGVFGKPSMPIGTSSTVAWANLRLRVALALDNTGSMAAANKMGALKTAAHNLLDQLQKASKVNGDVYVSIIPFNKDVNVGASNYAQSWVRWDLWDAQNGLWCKKNGKNCDSDPNGKEEWLPNPHNTWNGCVTDRDQDYDTTNTPVSATAATKMVAEQFPECPVEMIGLTYDWTALNQKIDAMFPTGNTNQAIGLQMAWQSITGAPFTVAPKDPNYDYVDAIILLTDGLNTQDRWYTDQASIDAREKKTCDNVKAAGVVLYTIHVNTDAQPTSTLLQQCATDPDKAFVLTSSSDIVSVFDNIGAKLTKLHISK